MFVSKLKNAKSYLARCLTRLRSGKTFAFKPPAKKRTFEQEFEQLLLSQLLPAIDAFSHTLNNHNLMARVEEFGTLPPIDTEGAPPNARGIKISLEAKSAELVNKKPGPTLVFAIDTKQKNLTISFLNVRHINEQVGNLKLLDFELVKYKLIQLLSYYLFEVD